MTNQRIIPKLWGLIECTISKRQNQSSSLAIFVGVGDTMRLHRLPILAMALLAILLSSAHSRLLANPATSTITPKIITITTPASDPYTFTGMPATLMTGIYKFKYINESSVSHNFNIRGVGGIRSTPICSKCTKFITVTLSQYVNGVMSPRRSYFCEPHKSIMHGIAKTTRAT